MRETGAVSLVEPSAEAAPATTAIYVYPDRERQVFLELITDAQAVPGASFQIVAAPRGALRHLRVLFRRLPGAD
jgi:hypothetical protein